MPASKFVITSITLLVAIIQVSSADVSIAEKRELNEVRSILKGLEKRMIEKIHAKYNSVTRKSLNDLDTLKRNLEDAIGHEKAVLQALEDGNEVQRATHTKRIAENPRMPHREIATFHKKFGKDAALELPRMIHRDSYDSPRINKGFEQREVSPRMPHKDLKEKREKELMDDLKLKLLREITKKTSEVDELQDRSGECSTECIGIFDACLNSSAMIDVIRHFAECRERSKKCYNAHPACL